MNLQCNQNSFHSFGQGKGPCHLFFVFVLASGAFANVPSRCCQQPLHAAFCYSYAYPPQLRGTIHLQLFLALPQAPHVAVLWFLLGEAYASGSQGRKSWQMLIREKTSKAIGGPSYNSAQLGQALSSTWNQLAVVGIVAVDPNSVSFSPESRLLSCILPCFAFPRARGKISFCRGLLLTHRPTD